MDFFFFFSELWWHFFNGAMYHNAFQNVEIGEIGEKVLHPDHLGILQIYTHLAGKQNMNRPILDTVKDGVVMEWR